MSASSQNFVYIFGKKRKDIPTNDVHTISPQRMEQIRKSIEQYLPRKNK